VYLRYRTQTWADADGAHVGMRATAPGPHGRPNRPPSSSAWSGRPRRPG